MAKFEEHCDDCQRLIGSRCEEVNHWMDQAFAKYGPRHRFDRHHWEGISKCKELFGDLGEQAAIVHVLKDCGIIPTESDYSSGRVDVLGMNPELNFVGFWDPKVFDTTAKAWLYVTEEKNK